MSDSLALARVSPGDRVLSLRSLSRSCRHAMELLNGSACDRVGQFELVAGYYVGYCNLHATDQAQLTLALRNLTS
jgi:hypothetical protein